MHAARPLGTTLVRGAARPDPELIRSTGRARAMPGVELREAIERGSLGLVAVPVHALQDGRADHHELRPHGGPSGQPWDDTLLQVAEETGLTLPLGDWLFDRAAHGLAARPAPAAGRLALRLSPIQLQAAPAYLGRWLDRLDALGVEPDRLVLSITEPILAARAETRVPALARLRARTVRLDRSLLRGIEHDAQVLARCEGLIEQAHQLGLQVMAADIDSAAQLAVLEAIGCDLGQGRVFANGPDLFTVNSA